MKLSPRPLCTFAFLLVTVITTTAQNPQIKWKKSMGGSNYDEANSIQLTKNGGYILAGFSQSTDGDVTGNHGAADYWVAATDNHGAILWEKSYGGSGSDYAKAIKPTSDGGYIVAGTTNSHDGDVTNSHGTNDVWIVKLDSAGSIQWQHSYGGAGYDEADDIVQTSDGGYAFAGFTTSINGDVMYNHGYNDEWIVRIDNLGNILWEQTFGGTGDDFANSIQQTADQGFIVAGETDSQDGNVTFNHGSSDYWVIKLDGNGNMQWQKTYGGSSDDNATSVLQTAEGGYIVAGATYSTSGDVTFNHGGYDDWIVKLDNLGNLSWQKCYGGSSYDYAFCIQPSTYGYIIAGYSSSNDGDVTGHHGSTDYDDYWVLGISNKGLVIGEVSLGGSGQDAASCIQQTPDGGMVVAGLSYSNDDDVAGHHGMTLYDDYWVVRMKTFKSSPYTNPITARSLDANQQNGSTSVSVYPSLNHGAFELSANNLTTSSATANVVIVNENGQVVLSRTESVSNGSLQDRIQLEDLQSGAYFVRVEADGNDVLTTRFICQR